MESLGTLINFMPKASDSLQPRAVPWAAVALFVRVGCGDGQQLQGVCRTGTPGWQNCLKHSGYFLNYLRSAALLDVTTANEY